MQLCNVAQTIPTALEGLSITRSNKWGLSLDTLSNSPMELSLSEFIVYGSVSLHIHQSRNSNGNLST